MTVLAVPSFQVHAGHGSLYDHDVVVSVVLPVQKFYDLRTSGALIGHECQAYLHGDAIGMTRLMERKYDAWMEMGFQIMMTSFTNQYSMLIENSFVVYD